jgi:hypothetical protein
MGIVLLGVVSLGFFAQSCSKDDDYFSDATAVNSVETNNLIASKYLELTNNQYVLNLSEKEANALGISKSEYDRMQTEITQANAFIIDCQNKGVKFELNDDKGEEINAKKIRLKSFDESSSSNNSNYAGGFRMTADGVGGGGSTSINIPNGVTKIKISLYTPCLASTCSGIISCGGQTISYGVGGIYTGATTISLPFSNTSMTINGITLCSGGGTVKIYFIYE